ncbi:hypothetical protein TNCV_295301 [Trichonephila clavipes]|nr:hypothetical protein TNCV_295301 [Trichonephila clavipes]
MTIGGEDRPGRCGLTWLLPDLLKAESFTWERAGWLFSDWMMSGEDNDSYWLSKGSKKLQNGKWEMLAQLENRRQSVFLYPLRIIRERRANDSYWLSKGFKKLQNGKWEMLAQLENRRQFVFSYPLRIIRERPSCVIDLEISILISRRI